MIIAVALSGALVLPACGSDDEGPPPTLGGATVVERPEPT
jgi:hypothetical protein